MERDSSWETVDPSQVRAYLMTLAPRGEGSVRALSVYRVRAQLDPPDPSREGTVTLDVDVLDTQRGRWSITVTGVRLVHPDYDTWAEVIAALERGTCQVTPASAQGGSASPGAGDLAGRLDLYRRATGTIPVTFDALTVRKAPLPQPGQCVACGSTTFRMVAQVTFPAHSAVDPDGTVRYMADAKTAAELVASAHVVSRHPEVICATCDTPTSVPSASSSDQWGTPLGQYLA